MAFKIYRSGNYFIINDTSTGEDILRQVRDNIRWEKKDDKYSFFLKSDLLQKNEDQFVKGSRDLKQLPFSDLYGPIDFSDTVDLSGTAWASQSVFDLYLEQWTGHICCSDLSVSSDEGNSATIGTDGLIYVPTAEGGIRGLPLVKGSNVTGTTAITISASLLIPAHTIVSDSVVKIEARAIRVSGTAATIVCQVYKNTTNSLSGATLIATYNPMTASNYISGISRNIFIDVSANQLTVMNGGATVPTDYVNTGTNTVVTFDETVDNYILFALQTTNAGDTGKIQFVHTTIHE